MIAIIIVQNLPHDLSRSSMVALTDEMIVLVDGYSYHNYGSENALIELEATNLKWKKIKVLGKESRYEHLAFVASNELINIFCGKTFS